MTTLTVLTLAVIGYGLVRPRHFPHALAVGGATPAGAALVAGQTAVPTFYAVALGGAVLLFGQLLARSRSRRRLEDAVTPGLTPLLMLALWGVVVTLMAPVLFDGQRVYAPGGAESFLTAGTVTSSNLAQVGYLFLSVCVVVLLSRSAGAGTEVIGLATGLAVLLSLWAYLGREVGVPFPVGFFDNSPAFSYIDGAPGGVVRFRGVFSEPAGLAVSCLVAAAYSCARLPQVSGLRRLGVLFVLVVSAFLGSISTSTTFVVAAVALVVLAIGTWLAEVVIAHQHVALRTVAAACAAMLAAPFVIPVAVNLLSSVVNAKLGTSSYRDRSGVDSGAVQIALDTYGFGVGLGANRASSFAASLLSTVGVVGVVLFVVAVAVVVRLTFPVRELRPVTWALAAALVTKVISGPDLNDTSGLLWLALGVLAHGAAVRTAAVPVAWRSQLVGPRDDDAQPGARTPSSTRSPGPV